MVTSPCSGYICISAHNYYLGQSHTCKIVRLALVACEGVNELQIRWIFEYRTRANDLPLKVQS